MRVIVGCEFSQIVMTAFLEKGHDAYSCDIEPCEGNYPERHYQEDILHLLKREKFDLGIFHPSCTFIANSGARWLFEKKGRWEQLDKACEFFRQLLYSPIPRICVENPQPHKWGTERIGMKYTQKVHPYHFGDKQKKGTCLWLKNLPLLKPTTPNLKPPQDKMELKKWEMIWRMPPGKDQAKNRSRTFVGMAKAMSEQWN